MAKKKTTKTGAKPVGDALRAAEKKTAEKRAELAVERTVCWLQLYATLDEIQVDAREYFRFGLRISDAEIDAEIARHPTRYRHGREDVEWGLNHQHRWRLTHDLDKLARRLPAIGFDKVDSPGRKAVDDLLRACQDKSFEPDCGFSKLVADAMRVARAVAEIDAGLAKVGTPSAHRKPSPLEAAILDVLLDADGSLSAKEIASHVQRTLRKSTESTAVNAAMGKLRRDCGFPELYAGDAGFKLTPDQRALAAKILGK
jgi:hypothetical protein